MSVFALIVFSIVIFVLFFTERGRKEALDLIEKRKQNLMWNGIITISFVNYLGFVIKARAMIINENEEEKNTAIGIVLSLLLLSYPFFIAYFLKFY